MDTRPTMITFSPPSPKRYEAFSGILTKNYAHLTGLTCMHPQKLGFYYKLVVNLFMNRLMISSVVR